MIGKITTLNHKVRNNTVESRTFVAKSLLAGTKRTEVFYSPWYSLPVQLNLNTTSIFSVDINIKIDAMSDLWLYQRIIILNIVKS